MSISPDDSLHILLVEDNPGDATLFEHHLTSGASGTFPPATVTHVETLPKAVDELEAADYDLVLLDLGLPGSNKLTTLDRYNDAIADSERSPVPVVVLTGLQDDATAVEAIERGAQDYLVKDNVDQNVLHRTLRYALERHAQQQELRRQNDRLEKFASVVSHDLRNPLSVAQGRIEMVDDEHADVIERNLDRIETIIDDVLTLAREGRSVEETEPVDLTTLITNCWENVETTSATLSTPTDISVMADTSRCRQLVENLIRNSVEHGSTSSQAELDDSVEHGSTSSRAELDDSIEQGSESVAITLGRLDDGFYIEDDGPGIPADERESVFEAGYTTNRDGTGFGLNIVQEIAEAHGWAVRITAGTDGGARFEFTGVTFA